VISDIQNFPSLLLQPSAHCEVCFPALVLQPSAHCEVRFPLTACVYIRITEVVDDVDDDSLYLFIYLYLVEYYIT
jgi:hypothetical protein